MRAVAEIPVRPSMRVSVWWVWVFLCLPSLLVAQSSISGLKRQADRYFEAGQYRPALKLYRQAGLEKTKDKHARLRIGICMYEIHDVEGAIRMFLPLVREGKTDPAVFLQLAKSYQARNQFSEAILYYKRFLQKTKTSDPFRPWVKDELIRCTNGARLRYAVEIAYVENAGTSINTQFNEFGVRTSPTIIDRIYFNSDREDIERGKVSPGNMDIYTSTLVNGQWNLPTPLPMHINTKGYEELCGFSSDGQILYYLSQSGQGFVIRTDTFSGETGMKYEGFFTGPFTSHPVADLIFFNDSLCMFASDMPGGFGGYDLYVSLLTSGNWSKPLNLGPTINSFFDDRFPFLTRDGLTLYFSSNNTESIGGFDVFSSRFDPVTLAWSLPENLGFPVNSSLDDTHLIMAPDGMSAYVSSNRKEGHGGEDIYRVFFKQPILAHQQISELPSFYHLLKEKGIEQVMPTTGVASRPVEVKEYFISHLFLEEQTDILTPQNLKKLDLVVNLMQIYPRLKVELSCFELPTGQRTFNLYFSIKKAEKAAEYLERKGIKRQRILLKGYGSSYPLVSKPITAAPGPMYKKLNQRLEITVHEFEHEPVIIYIENIQVPENVKDPRGIKFSTLRHELYYGVQIASISQILQNQDLESVDELYIDVDNTQGHYQYMVGMSPTYAQAESVRAEMMQIGFPEAKVIPYINGIRIARLDVADRAGQYPDLLRYLNATRK